MVEAAGDDEKELAAQMAAEFLNEDLAEQQFGAPKAGPGMWASLLRMLDPIKVKIASALYLEFIAKAERFSSIFLLSQIDFRGTRLQVVPNFGQR